jgi:hypothetical protein
MGRSIVCSKTNNQQHLKLAIRRCVRALLAMACIAPVCSSSIALAQLKTGRDAPREYYPTKFSAEVPRPSKPSSQVPSKANIRQVKSSAAKSLESISDDPPAEDLPQLAGSHQADSLPKILAGQVTAESPDQSSARTNKPVVLEVLPARFESPQSTNSTSSNRAIALAAHQAATRQIPSNSSNVIKRVTPSRVVSDQVIIEPQIQSGLASSHEDESSTYHADSLDGGTLVEDPAYEPYELVGDRGNCGDPHCTECGPSYPTLNIRIGFPPLLRCDRITARLEAATFWPTSQTLPGLVRTAEIGVPGSTDLFGGSQNLDQSVQGIRGEFGYRFGFSNCNTLQFRFFDAGAQSLTFDSPRSTVTSIVRPYQDGASNPIVQDSVSIKEPGISDGSVLAHAYSDVQGGDILLKRLWFKNCDASTEWLVGYQSTRINDAIDVHSTTVPIGSTNVLELRDQFRSVNQFNGATFGLSRMVYSPRWSLGSMFKLGLGDLQRDVTISGFQKVGSAPASTNGLLARSPANGFYSTNTFVFSPEVNVTLGYRLTQNLEATLGYTYLGLPKVARAGQQIDTVSDLDSASPTRPRFTLQESNFSLHSLNYGLQYRY